MRCKVHGKSEHDPVLHRCKKCEKPAPCVIVVEGNKINCFDAWVDEETGIACYLVGDVNSPKLLENPKVDYIIDM